MRHVHHDSPNSQRRKDLPLPIGRIGPLIQTFRLQVKRTKKWYPAGRVARIRSS